ncbi:hypothetical protein M8J76_017172 [Diaphorina citri]|nr:hypothetical protein M8J76_017172 [Diaphorina citri]
MEDPNEPRDTTQSGTDPTMTDPSDATTVEEPDSDDSNYHSARENEEDSATRLDSSTTQADTSATQADTAETQPESSETLDSSLSQPGLDATLAPRDLKANILDRMKFGAPDKSQDASWQAFFDTRKNIEENR